MAQSSSGQRTIGTGEILVTGGTGYIGSHACVALIAAGYRPVIIDNLSNSHAAVVDRIAAIAGQRPAFRQVDIRDAAGLRRVFTEHRIDAVMHFAGLKAVGESVSAPLRYYDNNVGGSITLFSAMREAGVRRVVFSSSATVYGEPDQVPITESAPIRPANPYGETKAAIERILQSLARSESGWQIAILRYFNPVGAHSSGLIGEAPQGHPNNLMPFVAQVAVGQRPCLEIFGNDYATRDGTGVRDYIHVMDLADAHIAALQHLPETETPLVVNVGTGTGYSVLEMVRAFEKASGKTIQHRIVGRRPGDVASCYADVTFARRCLEWQAKRTLEEMCADAWRWQRANPKGYAS